MTVGDLMRRMTVDEFAAWAALIEQDAADAEFESKRAENRSSLRRS